MPHQCVKCGTFYSDGSAQILSGCTCGARLFFYVKKAKVKKAQEVTKKLTKKQKETIEQQVQEIVGIKEEKEEPVVLDFEAINVLEAGKFEIDLVNLFNKDRPVVYKLEEGKYIIDLPETFKREINE